MAKDTMSRKRKLASPQLPSKHKLARFRFAGQLALSYNISGSMKVKEHTADIVKTKWWLYTKRDWSNKIAPCAELVQLWPESRINAFSKKTRIVLSQILFTWSWDVWSHIHSNFSLRQGENKFIVLMYNVDFPCHPYYAQFLLEIFISF